MNRPMTTSGRPAVGFDGNTEALVRNVPTVGVAVDTRVGVRVGVAVMAGGLVGVAVRVGVDVAIGVLVGVRVAVETITGVFVAVLVGVAVAILVLVGVAVGSITLVGVAVGVLVGGITGPGEPDPEPRLQMVKSWALYGPWYQLSRENRKVTARVPSGIGVQ